MKSRTAIISRISSKGFDTYGGCDYCHKEPRVLFCYTGIPMQPYSPRWFCNLKCHDAFMAD